MREKEIETNDKVRETDTKRSNEWEKERETGMGERKIARATGVREG